jgi:hypothetical protein
MAKNKLSRSFKANLTRDDWGKICPLSTYKVLDYQEATSLGLYPSGMQNINSVVVGASGSADGPVMYMANAFRIDGPNMDQEPYFEIYDSGSSASVYHGNFHHADFPGRTQPLSTDDFKRTMASGSMVELNFKGLPADKEGRLEELHQKGLLEAFDYTYTKGQAEGGKASSTNP